MKKNLALFLCLFLCLFAFSFIPENQVFALGNDDDSIISGDYGYELLPDGSAKIVRYYGSAEDLSLPSELDGHIISSLSDDTFYDCSSLVSLTIPDSITSVSSLCLRSCINLQLIRVSPNHPVLATIDGVLFNKTEKALIYYPPTYTADAYAIPEGIQSIGENAFSSCTALTSITIPDTVTSIDKDAFFGCSSLAAVTIPGSVSSIGTGIFRECRHLRSVIVLEGVPGISDEMFDNCRGLNSVTLPNSVLSIGERAFHYCLTLTDLTLPDNLTFIGEEAFYDCAFLPAVTIPESVTSIGDWAFFGCNALTSVSVTVPANVKFIGKNSFFNMTLTVTPASYAEQYAQENNVAYKYADSSLDWLTD